MKNIKEQIQLIKRGTDEIIEISELEKKLSKGKALVVKTGFDPSAPDIHLGHTVLLRKMKHFQQLGHKVFFLIGDFTARIGDPTGRSKLRKQLTKEEVLENAKTYEKQIFKVLDKEKTKIVFNSSWCEQLGVEGFFDLTSRYTVARLLERDDFSKRYKENLPISVVEFLYPLLQGYDSVVMKSDVELGGRDQKFNLLIGRDLQRSYGVEPQVIITMPILEGLDGVDKMSKSLNNYIGIDDSHDDMFGKVMSISDNLMWRYYELLTDVDYCSLKEDVKKARVHPKDVKIKLAKTIVSEYYGFDIAEKSKINFEKVFAKKQNPENMVEFFLEKENIVITDLIREIGFSRSTSEARRLVMQNAVSINDKKITDIKKKILLTLEGFILNVGKRKFAKIFKDKKKQK